MMTYKIWNDRYELFGVDNKNDLDTITICVLMTIITLPLDFIALPIEIVSFIIYRILNRSK